MSYYPGAMVSQEEAWLRPSLVHRLSRSKYAAIWLFDEILWIESGTAAGLWWFAGRSLSDEQGAEPLGSEARFRAGRCPEIIPGV